MEEQGLDWETLPAEKKFEILRETGMAERLAKRTAVARRSG